MEECIQALARVAQLHIGRGGTNFVVTGVEHGGKGAALGGLKHERYAHFRPHGLKHFGKHVVGGVGKVDEGNLKAVFIAFGGQHFLGLGGVVLVFGQVVILTLEGGRNGAVGLFAALYAVYGLADKLGIGRMVQGFTNVYVVKGFNGGVEADIAQRVLGACEHIHVAAFLNAVYIGGLETAVQIDIAGLKIDGTGGAFGHYLQHNGLKLGGFAPVVLVALKGDAFAGGPIGNHVRAGTYGRAAVSILTHFGDGLFVHYAHNGLAKLSLKEGIGLGGLYVHGVIINRFNAAQVNVGKGAGAGGGVRKAVDGIHNVLGGEVFAIGEVNVVAQLELPGQVVNSFPLGGKVSLGDGVLVKLEQSVEHVAHDYFVNVAGYAAGIERSRLTVNGYVDGILVGHGLVAVGHKFRILHGSGFHIGGSVGSSGVVRISGILLCASCRKCEYHRTSEEHCQVLFHVYSPYQITLWGLLII